MHVQKHNCFGHDKRVKLSLSGQAEEGVLLYPGRCKTRAAKPANIGYILPNSYYMEIKSHDNIVLSGTYGD